MVSNMVQYMVLLELIYNGHPDIIHRDRSHHYLGKARLESMLPDNFDALNACFRDTVITILLVQRELSGDRWIHGTVGIKNLVSIRMHVMTRRSWIGMSSGEHGYSEFPRIPLFATDGGCLGEDAMALRCT